MAGTYSISQRNGCLYFTNQMVIQDGDRRGLTMALVDIRMTKMCEC